VEVVARAVDFVAVGAWLCVCVCVCVCVSLCVLPVPSPTSQPLQRARDLVLDKRCDLTAALLRTSCNQFGLYGRGWQDIALFVCVQHLHLVNHSCFPNVCLDHVSAVPSHPVSSLADADDDDDVRGSAPHAASASQAGMGKLEDYKLGSHGPQIALRCFRPSESE
jgi:hypothetical protein